MRIFRDFRDSGSGRQKINTSSVNGFKSCENSSFLRKTVNPRAGRGGKILRSRNLTVFIFCQILGPARNFQARFRCWQNRLFLGRSSIGEKTRRGVYSSGKLNSRKRVKFLGQRIQTTPAWCKASKKSKKLQSGSESGVEMHHFSGRF